MGVRSYKFSRLLLENKPFNQHALVALFSLLWPGDWKKHMGNINKQITLHNRKTDKQQSINHVSKNEFWVFVGLLSAAGGLGIRGSKLWKSERKAVPAGFLTADVGFDGANYMSKGRFDEL